MHNKLTLNKNDNIIFIEKTNITIYNIKNPFKDPLKAFHNQKDMWVNIPIPC